MRIRVVIADESEAQFYDLDHYDAPLTLAGKLTDPLAHLHDRDFKSDRPGRVFDHASGGKRRGAVAHHGTGGERTPRKHEAVSFARKIAVALEHARTENCFDRLIVAAGPPFLGLLRAALETQFHSEIAAEIPKDLVHTPRNELHAYLPREAFYHL